MLTQSKNIPFRIIFIFLLVQIFAVSFLSVNLYFSITLYTIAYWSVFLVYLFCIKHNKLSIVLTGGFIFYFYQVPLILIFQNVDSLYKVHLLYNELMIYFYLYSLIQLLFLPLIVMTSSLNPQDWNIKWNNKSKFYFYFFIIMSVLLILYAIKNTGGIDNYLTLNKFEASEAQKTGVFTFKTFALLAIPIGLSSGSKKANYLTYVFMALVSFFDLISEKRFMIMAVVVFLFIYKINITKISFKLIFFSLSGIVFMIIIKNMYYHLGGFIFGDTTLDIVFWFDLKDVFLEAMLVGEGNSHCLLTANVINKDITNIHSLLKPTFFSQLFSLIPMSRGVVDYTSAGEFMRIYVNEPWSGLASCQYIVPFISAGYVGVIIIYSIIYLFYRFLFLLLRSKILILRILILSYLPVILFYFNREEIVCFKDMYLMLILLIFSNFIYLIFSSLKDILYGKNLPPNNSAFYK